MLRERRANGADVALGAVQAAFAAAVRGAQLNAHAHVTTGTNKPMITLLTGKIQ